MVTGMRTRVELSEYMVKLLEEAGRLTRTTVNQALDRLLLAIELHASGGKLDIGIEWTRAAAAVQEAAENEPEPQTDFPDVDHALLEHGKSRTGFNGVYFANGKFRAIVPDPAQGGGAKTLPGRTTALEAAVDRYRWYQEHGIPYGNLGWHVALHQEQHPEKSIEQCLLWAHDLVSSGTYGLKKPFTLEQVEKTLAQHRKLHGITPPEEKPPTDTSAPVTATLSKVMCAVCKDEIADGEPFAPHPSARDAWAHAGCV